MSEAAIGTVELDAPVVGLSPEATLRTLIYFDIFSYPLTAAEVLKFCDESDATVQCAEQTLAALAEEGVVHQQGKYFGIRPLNGMVERREIGNRHADRRMWKAERMCRFIAKFPYVEAVMISGSLSKGYLAPDGDIDQFIVTKPGRLWVARTLLILYKKVFLLNSHRDLCVNYFITSDDLRIEDENLFTATELITLMPMVNDDVHRKLMASNAWATKRFPNYPASRKAVQDAIQRNLVRRSIERMSRGKFGEWLDEKCMRLTVGYWQRKFKDFDPSLFEVALRSRRNVSKHHPNNYQQKVLNAFEQRVQQLKTQHGIKI